jgi:hypothetical protein
MQTLDTSSFPNSTRSERQRIIHELQLNIQQNSSTTNANANPSDSTTHMDPTDQHCIDYVKHHQGDMKLKTSLTYIKNIPIHMHQSVRKKQQELLHVYKEIQDRKLRFNKKLQALRVYKLSVIHTVNTLATVLHRINQRMSEIHSSSSSSSDSNEQDPRLLKLSININEFHDLSVLHGIVSEEQTWKYYSDNESSDMKSDEKDSESDGDMKSSCSGHESDSNSTIQLLIHDTLLHNLAITELNDLNESQQ